MDELIYGVWEGRRYDNRRRLAGDFPEGFPLDDFVSFNNGNPVTGFVGAQGFLIFDNRVTLAETLWRYYDRAKALSCGRCTPCRMGVILIEEALDAARRGKGKTVDWERIRRIADQMAQTSLCGVGETTPVALLGALEHFPELLRDAPPMPPTQADFYAVATAPCIEACPSHVNIPRYIDYIRDGHPELATGVLLKHYPLVGSCGRVCVRPCEQACTRQSIDTAVAIKDLKRYASDHAGAPIERLFDERAPDITPVSMKVAVVGAGPAGINCAYHLLRRGHHVDIYEAQDYAGGMARLGIPAYRLSNKLLETETEVIERVGGHYHFGQRLGTDFTIDTLFEKGYRAVFLGVGCSQGHYMGLPGEDTTAQGYLKGIDFLLDVEHHQSSNTPMALEEGDVVVVGCGNVAMDCCRTARRLLKKGNITVTYRRTQATAPADPEEIIAAKEEGIDFEFLTSPVEVLTQNGTVVGVKLIRMQEGEPDASGRRCVTPIPNSEFVIPCRYVIAAVGQKLDTSIFCEADGIRITKRGCIEVDAALHTSREGVFAGGDAAAGPTSLIWGMAQGQTAASSIHEFLMSEATGFIPRRRMTQMIKKAGLLKGCTPSRPMVPHQRHQVRHTDAATRIGNWDEVEFGMTSREAQEEAKRCLRCYRLFALMTLRPIPGKSEMEEL